MKPLLLVILIAVSLLSCVKTVDVNHDIHDTTYINLAGHTDTVNHFAIIHDTIVRSSVANDTVQIVKHDTLYITTTRIDTVLRYFIDTAYITRTVHDTVIRVQQIVKVQHDTTQIWSYDTVYVAKNVIVHDTVTRLQYLHDTINNMSVVYLHDTIVRIDKEVTVDTVLRYNSLYPVPAIDSVVMKYYCDTPNHQYKDRYGYDSGSYVKVNYFIFTSVIPSPDGSYQTFIAYPRYDTTQGRIDDTHLLYGGTVHEWIVVAPRMLATVAINYDWNGAVQTLLDSYGPFEQQPSTVWTLWSWGKIASCIGCTNTSVAIPLADVSSIYVRLN